MNFIPPDTLNTLYIILAVAVVWVVLRFVLKIAMRIFAIGCLAIVIIGAALFLIQSMGGA